LISVSPGGVFAQAGGRAAVIAKQQIRAELAASITDGKLSRIEQRSILLKGKKVLSPDQLRGLLATTNRLVGSTSHIPGEISEDIFDEQSFEKIGRATLTRTNSKEYADTAAYEESLKAADEPLKIDASPFKEEIVPIQPAKPLSTMTPVQQFQKDCNDCDNDYDAGCGEEVGDCGSLPAYECKLFNYMPMLYSDVMSNISLTTSVDAFKGPMDLDNTNGNFGINFAFNSGIPVFKQRGVGIQVGTSGVLSDFHGTNFTGSTIRQQNFTTVGIYRRNPSMARGVNFGFAFDWLRDQYYASVDMSQWRVQLSYELNSYEEVGILACIPNDGETVVLGNGVSERFKPVAYGNLFYTRNWKSGRSLTGWIGVAEEPGAFIFGGSGRIPLTERLALVGNLNYVLPSASGVGGQDEEMWNMSMGIELRPSPMTRRCGSSRFAPLFSLANNGTFAIRRY
jgi:hypothetical protein